MLADGAREIQLENPERLGPHRSRDIQQLRVDDLVDFPVGKYTTWRIYRAIGIHREYVLTFVRGFLKQIQELAG